EIMNRDTTFETVLHNSFVGILYLEFRFTFAAENSYSFQDVTLLSYFVVLGSKVQTFFRRSDFRCTRLYPKNGVPPRGWGYLNCQNCLINFLYAKFKGNKLSDDFRNP